MNLIEYIKKNDGELMEIRNIQTFLRVAELSSFTKAAVEMNYVQSTVTMQIQQLEKELGFPLFDRIGKHISLTLQGNEFLAYSQKIMNTVYDINMFGKHPCDITGTLKIGVLESLLFSVMINVLPDFSNKYKNINVQLKTGQAQDLIILLKQNQLDMIYISFDYNSDPDLFCWYTRPEKIVFLTGSGNILAKRRDVALSEVLEQPLVATEPAGICYNRLRILATQNDLMLRHSLMVDSTVAVAELIRRGVGVAFLPEYSVENFLHSGEIVKVNVDIPVQTYYSQVLCHKNKWMPFFMQDVIDLIGKYRPQPEPPH